MAYSSGFTAATGATYTAAQYNTYTRDNFAAIWVFTTAGDLVYATSSTTASRLGLGAAGYVLISNGTAPAWVSVATLLSGSGQALVTGQTTGDIFYAATAANLARLAIGAAGYVLICSGGLPAWVPLASLASGSGQPLVTSQAAGDWFYAVNGNNLGRVAGVPYGIPHNDAAGTGAAIFTQNETTRAKRATDFNSTLIAETALQLDGEDMDDGTWHSNTVTPVRITPVSSGRYQSKAQMKITNASGTNIDSITVNVWCSDGDLLGTCNVLGFITGTTLYIGVPCKTKDLTATQYIYLSTSRSNVNSGVTINSTDTWLEVERVR